MTIRTADQSAPARKWFLVTPSDTDNLPSGCRGIFVGGTGNIVLVGDDDVAATFEAIPVATFMPTAPRRVNATGTTATLIKALY